MIVEIFMSHRHGLKSMRLVQQRAPRRPLIAMSGDVFVEQRPPALDVPRMALELGTRCLRKPLTLRERIAAAEACPSESETRGIEAGDR